jgi:hypothetical protein
MWSPLPYYSAGWMEGMLSVSLSNSIGIFSPKMNGSDTSKALIQTTQRLICTLYQAEYKLKSIYANGVFALSYSAKATKPFSGFDQNSLEEIFLSEPFLDSSLSDVFESSFNSAFGSADTVGSWHDSQITAHQAANMYALVDSMVSAISGDCSVHIASLYSNGSRFTLPNGTTVTLDAQIVLHASQYTGQY